MLDDHSLGLFFLRWECAGVNDGGCGRNLVPPYAFSLEAGQKGKSRNGIRVNFLEELIAPQYIKLK